MRILITNDDGIYSPGIATLAEMAAQFGEVRVVAPDVEQSSAGHSITATRPLSYKRTPIGDFEAYRVNGTPADCVALGSYHWEKVDVVLSGINLGSNLGNAMWHSGTLAAAKQAALLGLRGIALSLQLTRDEPNFDILKPSVKKVLELLLHDQGLTLVNVNFPDKTPRGLRWTRQSVTHYDGKVVPGRRPYEAEIVLVHCRPHGRGGGRHGSVGHRAGLRVDNAASPRSHKRKGIGRRHGEASFGLRPSRIAGSNGKVAAEQGSTMSNRAALANQCDRVKERRSETDQPIRLSDLAGVWPAIIYHLCMEVLLCQITITMPTMSNS